MKEDLENLLREAIAAMAEAAKTVDHQTVANDKQTATFVRQIEKLSSRLDEAHAQTIQLTKLAVQQQASYDRLFKLIEKLSEKTIINNSNN